MDRKPHESDDPQEQATHLAGAMVDALPMHRDYIEDETRAIALVYPNTGRGGVCLHGYEGDVERAVFDALQSLDALLQTVGMNLHTFKMPEVGRG